MGFLDRSVLAPWGESRRRLVRSAAAALAALTALLYFLIGAGVFVVSEAKANATDAPDIGMFGLSAGATFVLGAILLLAFDHRLLWAVGAVYQVMVIAMYVGVASTRTPNFEATGITIKLLQAAILVALVYLAVRPIEASSGVDRRIGGATTA